MRLLFGTEFLAPPKGGVLFLISQKSIPTHTLFLNNIFRIYWLLMITTGHYKYNWFIHKLDHYSYNHAEIIDSSLRARLRFELPINAWLLKQILSNWQPYPVLEVVKNEARCCLAKFHLALLFVGGFGGWLRKSLGFGFSFYFKFWHLTKISVKLFRTSWVADSSTDFFWSPKKHSVALCVFRQQQYSYLCIFW